MSYHSFLVTLETDAPLTPPEARTVARAIAEGVTRQKDESGLTSDESEAIVLEVANVCPTLSTPLEALAWILEIAFDQRRENVCDVVPASAGLKELADLEAVATWYGEQPGAATLDTANLFDCLPDVAEIEALAARAKEEEAAALVAADPDAMSGPQALDAATAARVSIFQSEGDTFYKLPGAPDVIGPFSGAYAAARDALHALKA